MNQEWWRESFIRYLQATCLALAMSASASAADRLALNAPTCAQLTENYRLECRKACANNTLARAACERQCDDPDKLLEHLRRCEERVKPVG